MIRKRPDLVLIVLTTPLWIYLMFTTDFLSRPISTFPIYYWMIVLVVFVMDGIAGLILTLQRTVTLGDSIATLIAGLFSLGILMNTLTRNGWTGLALLFAFVTGFFLIIGITRLTIVLLKYA